MSDGIQSTYAGLVEERLRELLPVSDKPYRVLTEAARYSLLGGGKRIRPVILMEFCRIFGGPQDAALDFACALEMIHTYSLIHDDLPCMDNDDLRRGRPSCHKAFSEDTALLAGDGLLAHAFWAAANASALPERKAKAIAVLAERAGIDGMVGGQVSDLALEKGNPGLEELMHMYLLKTGCLLSAAAEIGSILAGMGEDTLEKARGYAENLALAFQIRDDILDIVGEEAVLGKPIGSDGENQKTTVATLLGVKKAEQLASELTGKALGFLDELGADTGFLKELTQKLLTRNF